MLLTSYENWHILSREPDTQNHQQDSSTECSDEPWRLLGTRGQRRGKPRPMQYGLEDTVRRSEQDLWRWEVSACVFHWRGGEGQGPDNFRSSVLFFPETM